MSDYFHGHEIDRPHPHMPATGTEGRCELCGERADAVLHQQWDVAYRKFRKDPLGVHSTTRTTVEHSPREFIVKGPLVPLLWFVAFWVVCEGLLAGWTIVYNTLDLLNRP